MEGSRGGASTTAAEGDLEEAQCLIMRWASFGAAAEDPMLFDCSNRPEAERYLRAVDEIRRSLKDPACSSVGSPRRLSSVSAPPSPCPANTMQVAMARLEDEFRHILVSRACDVEIESLVDLSSISVSNSLDVSDLFDGEGAAESAGEEESSPAAPGSEGSSVGTRRSSYRSMRSIREIDLLPPDAIEDLRSIAKLMNAAGYGRECVQVYSSVRKSAVDLSVRRLGIEKLSIGDVQRLQWEALESKIRRWIRAVRVAVRVVFASERRLCELIFNDDDGATDAPFTETVKGAALHLFGFAEAISIGRRSPEKLFKMIDLHDALFDLLPDAAAIFHSKSSESIRVQAAEILSRLADAVRGILSEFESAVIRDPPKIPTGGTIHPLTRYVMNYSGLISDYKATLLVLIVSRPSAIPRLSSATGDDPSTSPPELDFPEAESQTHLASHLIWITAVLQHNLESKASLYKDAALSHLFLMNNVHYIAHKVKDSPELREMIGDEYLRRLTGKFRQEATNYQRATWIKILHCLREEGLHAGGGSSSAISKPALRERFRAFNAAFDEVHRVQATWAVPDAQLREELRISIAELLLPAYRSFLGRFRQHIESGKHPEMYIKYSMDDLETALSDFFEGCPPAPINRRKSH